MNMLHMNVRYGRGIAHDSSGDERRAIQRRYRYLTIFITAEKGNAKRETARNREEEEGNGDDQA